MVIQKDNLKKGKIVNFKNKRSHNKESFNFSKENSQEVSNHKKHKDMTFQLLLEKVTIKFRKLQHHIR